MKKIGIIVTASVAIIKIYRLKTIFQEMGYSVLIIPTPNALANYPEIQNLNPLKINEGLLDNVEHINLAKSVNLLVVAPASANTISKFINGICDNLALTLLIAARQKILFAPAMNDFMYKAIVKRNYIEKLEKWGHYVIGPEIGWLREGDYAIGRMSEPIHIAKIAKNILENQNQLKKIIISYGASKIYLDPIRFITNKSSGIFGKLIIKELKLLGFRVDYIDVSKHTNYEILEKVKNYDIYISAAALSDFLVEKLPYKIKKNSIDKIQLKNNIDVLTELRKLNKKIKILGFKLDEDINNAIIKKNNLALDGMLFNRLNSMNKNQISGTLLINNKKIEFNNKAKYELAKIIAIEVKKWIYM